MDESELEQFAAEQIWVAIICTLIAKIKAGVNANLWILIFFFFFFIVSLLFSAIKVFQYFFVCAIHRSSVLPLFKKATWRSQVLYKHRRKKAASKWKCSFQMVEKCFKGCSYVDYLNVAREEGIGCKEIRKWEIPSCTGMGSKWKNGRVRSQGKGKMIFAWTLCIL